MIKVLNEKNRVNELLENGFEVAKHYTTTVNQIHSLSEDDWNSKLTPVYDAGSYDVVLLIKYFSGLGLKPREVKEKIIALWVNYDPMEDYKFLNKKITSVRAKNDYALREMDLTGKVMVHTGTIEYIDSLKVSVDIKKVLFTLYTWTQIQKTYRSEAKYNILAMSGSKDKLMKDSGVHKKYSTISKELGYLFSNEKCPSVERLGLIRCLTPEDQVCEETANKMKAFDPSVSNLYMKLLMADNWKIETDKFNEVGELVEINDLNNLGEIFDVLTNRSKEEMNNKTKICPSCGTEFERRSNNPRECCPECRRKKEAEKKRVQRARKKEVIG